MASDDAAARSGAYAVRRSRTTFDDSALQGAGVVQGGVLGGALADAVDAFAADVVAPDARCELETLDVRLERPAGPGECVVEATPTRLGRSLLAWDAQLVDANGAIVATARITYRVRAGAA